MTWFSVVPGTVKNACPLNDAQLGTPALSGNLGPLTARRTICLTDAGADTHSGQLIRRRSSPFTHR